MKGRDGLFENILNEVMSNVEEADAREAKIKEMITFYAKVLEGSNPYDAILKVAEEHELKPEEVFEMLKAGGHVNKETLDELKEKEADEAKAKEPKAEKPKELKSDADTGKLKSMEGITDEAAPKEPKAEKPKELGKGKKDLGKMQLLKSNKEDVTEVTDAPDHVLRQVRDAWELIGTTDDDPHVRSMSDTKVEEIDRALQIGQSPTTEESVNEKATPKGLRAKAKKADKEATKFKAKDDKAGAKKATKQANDLRKEADKLEKDLAKAKKKAAEGKVPEEGKDDQATMIKKLTEGEMAKEVDALVKQTKEALDDGNYQEAMDLAARLSQIKDALPSAGPTEPEEFSEPTPPDVEPVVPAEHEMERESKEPTEEEAQQTFLKDDRLQEMIDTALDAGGSFTEVSEAAKKKSTKKSKRGDAVFQSDHPKVTDDADHFPINSEPQARNALARANQYKKAPKWFDGSLDALVKAVASAVKKKFKSIDVSKEAEKPGKG